MTSIASNSMNKICCRRNEKSILSDVGRVHIKYRDNCRFPFDHVLGLVWVTAMQRVPWVMLDDRPEEVWDAYL
jgi:hypothetical protein